MEVPEIKTVEMQQQQQDKDTITVNDDNLSVKDSISTKEENLEVQTSESIFTENDPKTPIGQSLFEELSNSNFKPPESFSDVTIQEKPSSINIINGVAIDGLTQVCYKDVEKDIAVTVPDDDSLLIEKAKNAIQKKQRVHLIFDMLKPLRKDNRLHFMKEHFKEIEKLLFTTLPNVTTGKHTDGVYTLEDFYLDLEAISKIKCEIESGLDVEHFKTLYFETLEKIIPRLLTKFLDVDKNQTLEAEKYVFWDTMDQFVDNYVFKLDIKPSAVLKISVLLIDYISSEFSKGKGDHVSVPASHIMQRIFKTCVDRTKIQFEEMSMIMFNVTETKQISDIERFSLDPIVDPSETWLLETDLIAKKEYLVQVDENENLLRFYCNHKNELGTLSTYLTTFKHGQGKMCPLCEIDHKEQKK